MVFKKGRRRPYSELHSSSERAECARMYTRMLFRVLMAARQNIYSARVLCATLDRLRNTTRSGSNVLNKTTELERLVRSNGQSNG